MVNSINLTMTSKDQIATWKANRRKLVSALSPSQDAYSLKVHLGIFDRWYARLYCSGNIHAERLW
jgi:hypothetical protein